MRAQFDVVHKPGVRDACFARRTGNQGAPPVSARMLAASAGAVVGFIAPTAAPPAGRPYAQFMHGASGRASLRGSICTRTGTPSGRQTRLHAPSKELLPFGGHNTRRIRARAPSDSAGARARRHTGAGEAIDDETRRPVVNISPNTSRNPDHPISELMEATIEARDADPPRQIAAPVHDLHRPFVMTANILGGDDGNRQNLGVGDLRPYITAMPPGVPSTCQSRQKRL
jgi:hypothetical protein